MKSLVSFDSSGYYSFLLITVTLANLSNSAASAAAAAAASQVLSSSSASQNSPTASLGGTRKTRQLPECATQQVCNALFVRRNHTQSLCECSSNYNWNCSSEPNAQDGHTIELTRRYDKKVYTQVKVCEPLVSVRTCKVPTDWTLLSLQSERSGKAHYVVVCKCPEWAKLEGPYTHSHPPYARVPGIRVYGMLCAQSNRMSRMQGQNNSDDDSEYPEFPWDHAYAVLNTTLFQNIW